MNFQYKTICRGKQSLIEQLRRRLQPLGRDPLEYITFNSLRTYGELHGRVVTEQIYVHDKVSGERDVSCHLYVSFVAINFSFLCLFLAADHCRRPRYDYGERKRQ